MQSSNLKSRLAEDGAVIRVKKVTVTRRGDYVVFSGSPYGEHKIDYAASSPSRMAAHLAGYCLGAQRRRRS